MRAATFRRPGAPPRLMRVKSRRRRAFDDAASKQETDAS
jgi:hypothetical protein